MCRAATCEVCGKTTWMGCGEHIESVRVTVPEDQWCDGATAHEAPQTATA